MIAEWTHDRRLVWCEGPSPSDWSDGLSDAEKVAIFHQMVGAAHYCARCGWSELTFARAMADILADFRRVQALEGQAAAAWDAAQDVGGAS